MKLKLESIKQNIYTLKGIIIWDSSPEFWASEIQRMGLFPNRIKAYPLPGDIPNSVSGILIILNEIDDNISFAYNQLVQECYPNFYIPELTKLNIPLSKKDLSLLESPYFLHPTLGLIPLEKTLNWTEMLSIPKERVAKITSPAKSVDIPYKVNSIQIEVEEKELDNPFKENKVEGELPFNLKKVMQGNQKELEKFLQFLDKNPEAALKYAVPMDLLGTSRGKSIASYKFGRSIFDFNGFGFFNNLFNSKTNNATYTKKTSSNLPSIGLVIQIIIFIVISVLIVRSCSKNNRTIHATESFNNTALSSNMTFVIFGFLIVTFIVLAFLYWKKIQTDKKIKNPDWFDLPENNDIFSFKEKAPGRFYFGGENVPFLRKLFLGLVVLGITLLVIVPVIRELNFIGGILLALVGISFYKLIKT